MTFVEKYEILYFVLLTFWKLKCSVFIIILWQERIFYFFVVPIQRAL